MHVDGRVWSFAGFYSVFSDIKVLYLGLLFHAMLIFSLAWSNEPALLMHTCDAQNLTFSILSHFLLLQLVMTIASNN